MKNISKKTTSYYNPLMWLLAFLLSMSLLSNRVNAQNVAAYPFSNTSGSWSANKITAAGGATLWTSSTASTDDDITYSAVTIPFNFYYGGGSTAFNYVSSCSNGYMALGTTSSVSAYSYAYSGPLSGYSPYIAIAGYDMQFAGVSPSSTSLGSNVYYQTLGTAPNRVFVVQFNNLSWYPSSTSNIFSGQIRLYEGSAGIVKIIYGGSTTVLTGSSAQVGLNGSATSNYQIMSGTSFAAATASITSSNSGLITFGSSLAADSGRTFTWGTPPSLQVIDSVSTIQVTANVPVGGTAQAVIGVVYYTHGGLNPKIVTGILCNTTGTTSTSDISNAKIYYTGNTSTYTNPGAAIHQFGSTSYSSPSGAMYFTSAGDTLMSGANYYWLVYDITSSTSAIGDVVDGQCTLVTDSISRTPNVTAPAGNRTISGPMSGNYTINPSGTGGTNFTSFAAAIAAMNSNTISGPVKFLVSAATYTQTTPLILSCVSGASATNTVTFDGGNGNASTRIITGSLSSSALVYMSCNYYTIRNLTISNTASGCGGVGVLTGTVGNTINNCIISTGSNSSTSAGIFTALTTSTYYATGASTVDSLTIDSNTITNAYYGIYLYGNSNGANNRNFKIRGNTVSNIYNMGMYLYYIYNNMDILRNSVTMSPSYGYYGVYMYFCTNGSSLPTNFVGNKIMGAWGYSFFCYYPGGSTAANQFNFYNNWIIGANNSNYPYDYYGVYVYNGNSYNQIYHNTVLMPYSYTSSTYAGMSLNGNSYYSVKNNIIVNSATSGSAINLYCGSSVGNDSINYNVYWNSSNSGLVYNGGGTGTPSTFNTASNGGDSSVNMMPAFVSGTDLHLSSGCSVPSGANLTSFVSTDIDGNTRPAAPRRGACEANFLTLDYAMNAILSPASPVGTGSATVSVKIQNMGTTTITSAYVAYQFNGGTPVTTTWTGSLAICGTATVTFGTPVTLISSNTLKAYVYPTSGTDLNHNNDTIISTINASMAGGTYTINGSSPTSGTNFNTFAAAVSAMGAGILGPVVFNVASGTYTQSTSLIIPVIPGASATNTIVFEGGAGNAATRIITGSISAAALIYNSSPYVTFHNLTMNNTNTSNSGVIGFLASATGCKVSNCVITSANTSSTGANLYTATSTTDYYGSSGVGLDSLTIDSNTINGGYYGMHLYGTASAGANRNFKIRYNTVNGSYYMGIYLYYIYNNIDLLYNNVIMSQTLYGYFGVYMFYCTNGSSLPTNVIGNKIMNATGYGFYSYFPGGSTAANTFKFYNNMIIMGNNSSYPYDYYGLYLYNGNSYNQIYHNSVLTPISYSSSSYAGMSLNGNSYYSVKNNIIVNTASSGSAINLYCGTSVGNDSINFNVYYNKSNTQVVYNGGSYSTSSTFNTTTNGGDSSVYLLPAFVNNATDLHLSGPCSVPVGQSNLNYYVPTDIDQNTRSNPSRRGCSEPSFLANDLAMDSMTSPIPPIVSGAGASIIVRFKNVGSTPVYSALIYYSFNGATPVAYSWSGTLATCGTATITFGTGITLGSVNSLKVYTALPNGSADPNRSNDTLVYNYFTPLSGTYTINGSAATSGSNFHTFTDAINTIVSAGMAGPVLFNVLAGTYNENPVISGTILGLSAVNTITFEGGNGNAATRILTYPATGSAVFVVNNVKYVAIRNLTITNSVSVGTACAGVGIVGSSSSYNSTGCSVVGCIVTVPNPGGTSSTGYGITVTASANGNGASAMGADSITIDSNIINGSAYGIVCYGSSNASYNRGIRIRYNRVTGANYMGAYIYNNYNSMDFIGNYIHMNSSYGYYGVYFYYNTNSSTTTPTRFNGNTIDNYGGYGIMMYYPGGTATAPVQFYNNLLLNYSTSYGGYYGLYNYFANYMEMYHNTMILGYNGGSTSYSNLYNYVTNLWCKNNIFGVGSGSSATPAYFSTSPTGSDAVNYNDYYNLGSTSNLIYRGGLYTASGYLSSTIGGDSSYNFTPSYISPSTGNYGLSSNCSGFGAAGIFLNTSPWAGYSVGHDSIDILGTTRSIPLTLGAYQFNGTANDLAVVAVTTPTSPISAGSQPIKVRIGNTGTTSIYTTTMVYKLNGGTPVTLSYTNTSGGGSGLLPCAYDTITFTGVTLTTGNNTLKIWSSLPNSSADGNRNNDTINVILGTPMSGTYTVNLNTATGGTNYQTFVAAIADLNNRGVSGACTFNVTSGNYYPTGGGLNIGNLTGVSATNTITFKSVAGIPDSVIVNGNGSGYIVTYNAASYVTFNAISFVQPAAAGILNFTGGSSYDMVYNCKLTSSVGTSGNMVNMTSGFTNNVTIRKCNIYGGYYGVYLYNPTSWNYNITIDSNTIGSGYIPAYLYYSTNLKFNANNVVMGNGPYTYSYLYMIYCDSATEFAYNNISTPNAGSYGYIYTAYYSVGNATQHVLYHDNKIDASGSGTYISAYYPSYYGNYVDFYNNYWNLGANGYMYYMGYSAQNMRFYNNVVSSGYTGSYGSVYYYNSGVSNIDIENNIFYNTSSGYAFVYGASSPGTTEMVDNNVYFSATNTTPINGNSGTYSVATWKALTANTAVMRDKNSLQYYPGFTNTTSGSVNLASNLSDSSIWSLNGRGKPVSWIAKDILGNTRSTSVTTGPTDIGPYEFTPNTGNIPPLATPSSAPTSGATQTFTFGGDVVASIAWPSSSTVPTTVGVRVYPQSTPPQLGTLSSSWQYTAAYWNITAYPAGTYSWAPTLNYKDHWIKNIPSKSNMVFAGKYPTTSWVAGTVSGSVNDTVNDLLSNTSTAVSANITNTYLVGTTLSNGLPVQMSKIAAIRSGNNGIVNWTTASEINSDYFVVERSFDGINFTQEGSVKAAGNSATTNAYTYTDLNVVTNYPTASTIYYRLKMVDMDGTSELSNMVSINIVNVLPLGSTVYPNPFINELNITVNATRNTTAKVEVVDIQGRVVAVKSIDINKGDTKITVSELTNLTSGIYFVNMTMNGETIHAKVIKN